MSDRTFGLTGLGKRGIIPPFLLLEYAVPNPAGSIRREGGTFAKRKKDVLAGTGHRLRLFFRADA